MPGLSGLSNQSRERSGRPRRVTALAPAAAPAAAIPPAVDGCDESASVVAPSAAVFFLAPVAMMPPPVDRSPHGVDRRQPRPCRDEFSAAVADTAAPVVAAPGAARAALAATGRGGRFHHRASRSASHSPAIAYSCGSSCFRHRDVGRHTDLGAGDRPRAHVAGLGVLLDRRNQHDGAQPLPAWPPGQEGTRRRGADTQLLERTDGCSA